MKKSTATICAFALLGMSSLKAQTDKKDDHRDIRDRIVLGLKAGANFSNVYNSSGDNFVADPKLGFAGGGFIGIPIGKHFGLQPEILLSQKGYKSSGLLLGSPYSDTRTTTFLDVPLQLQLKPIELLTFLVGVQYSYLLHQSDKYVFGANSVDQQKEFTNDNARKNLLGAVIGVDINIRHLVLSAKACIDLQSNAANGSSKTPRYKNTWLQATVGYRIFS